MPWGVLVFLAFPIICGAYGNRCYLSHARRKVAEVRSRGLPEGAHLRALRDRGRTSVAAALGFFVPFLLAYAFIFSFLAVLSGRLLEQAQRLGATTHRSL